MNNFNTSLEITLVDSKFPKDNNHYESFDLVLYNHAYYMGFNLYKNFLNYLSGSWDYSVMRFQDKEEALNYMDKVRF